MSPYFRAFLFFIVACMVAFLFGMKVLAAAEPPSVRPVVLYLTDDEGNMGVIIADALAPPGTVACFALYSKLPAITCLRATGEMGAHGIKILERVQTHLVDTSAT